MMTTPEQIRGFVREARGDDAATLGLVAAWLREGMATPGFFMRLYDELQPGSPLIDTAIDLVRLEEEGDLGAMSARFSQQLEDPEFAAEAARAVTAAVLRALGVLLGREVKRYRDEGEGTQ